MERVGHHDSSYLCKDFLAGSWYQPSLQDPLQHRPQDRGLWDTRGLLPTLLLHPRLVEMNTHQNVSVPALASGAHRVLGKKG